MFPESRDLEIMNVTLENTLPYTLRSEHQVAISFLKALGRKWGDLSSSACPCMGGPQPRCVSFGYKIILWDVFGTEVK